MAPVRRNKIPPPGYDQIEPVLDALANELRDKVKESSLGKRKTESQWPVHQINWQRSRYVYDMYFTYNRITRKVYDYCIKNKIIDALLIAKWKKPGYENLCSTYVINPANYKFGTTNICRVPRKDRNNINMFAQDPMTGCLGCASGNDGVRNIFGNKYGQNLAAVQISREKRIESIMSKSQRFNKGSCQDKNIESLVSNSDGETTDDEDYGPSPSVGVWAGSKKVETSIDNIVSMDHNEEYRDSPKRVRTSSN